MGKRRTARLPTADKRLVLAGPVSIEDGGSMPFRDTRQMAYECGASGEPMPAWIAADRVCLVKHTYGDRIEIQGHVSMYPSTQRLEYSAGSLQKSFNAGAKSAANARSAMAAKDQLSALYSVLHDMGMPATEANIAWARKLSKQGGGFM